MLEQLLVTHILTRFCSLQSARIISTEPSSWGGGLKEGLEYTAMEQNN